MVLPGGDIAVADADRAAVVRVTREGGQTIIASGFSDPNGLALDEHGKLWVTTLDGQLVRVDPDVPSQEVVATMDVSLDGIAFAPGKRLLYFNSEGGRVWRMALSASGQPAEPEVFVDLEPYDKLDGMHLDVCGNLYVIDMMGSIYRVSSEGEVETFMDFMEPVHEFLIGFPCAVHFGSGEGGFERDNLYVMDLGGGLYELEVGIPGA